MSSKLMMTLLMGGAIAFGVILKRCTGENFYSGLKVLLPIFLVFLLVPLKLSRKQLAIILVVMNTLAAFMTYQALVLENSYLFSLLGAVTLLAGFYRAYQMQSSFSK